MAFFFVLTLDSRDRSRDLSFDTRYLTDYVICFCFFFPQSPVDFFKMYEFQTKTTEAVANAAQPITHPLYGAAPVSTNGFNDATGHAYSTGAPPMYGGQDVPQMFYPAAPTSANNFNSNAFNPGGFKQNAVNFNQAGVNNSVSGGGLDEKAEPVKKPPIPEEHVHMQTVFDELKNLCSCTANNPVSLNVSGDFLVIWLFLAN